MFFFQVPFGGPESTTVGIVVRRIIGLTRKSIACMWCVRPTPKLLKERQPSLVGSALSVKLNLTCARRSSRSASGFPRPC